MKKTIKTFLAMFLICLSSFAIFGCGAKVTKLEYVEGSMDTTLVVGEELVTTGFKAVATMSDDSQINLTEKDVEFKTDELDLTTSGNKELKYSYKDKTDTIEIVVLPDDVEISSLVYTGTMPTEIGLGDDIDFTNFAAEVTYDNGEKVTLHKNDVTFNMNAVDLTTTGEKHLPFTFQGKTNYVTFVIIESTEIKTFTSNLKNEYINNSETTVYGDTFDTSKTSFKIKGSAEKPYVVGDYNDFDPRISAYGYIFDEENIDVTEKKINNVATTTKVEKLTATEPKAYTELTAEEYDRYFDDISNVNGIMNFSADAINQEFKITITSKYYDETEHQTAPSFYLVVKVVSGYNVYDVKGLSLLDNSNKDNNKHYGWNEIKSNEEIALSNNINALILHNDIQIKDEHLPSTIFWSEEEVKNLTAEEKGQTNLPIVGSMKDHPTLALFNRKISGDFKLYGNYFAIDSSLVSKCVLDNDYDKVADPEDTTPHGIMVDHDAEVGVEDDEAEGEVAITIHSNLIFMEPMSNATAFKNVDFTDVSFLGNGPRSNRSVFSGGHILFKSQGIKLNVNNCVHKDYYIGYFPNKYDGVATSEEDNSTFVFENCVGTNAHNVLFYVYGAKDVKIINSKFTSAGGPVMVIDHVDPDENNYGSEEAGKDKIWGFPSNVEIIGSEVYSYVTGQESWFSTYPIAQALFTTEVQPLNNLLGYANQFTRINKTASFIQSHTENDETINNAINVVAVIKKAGKTDANGGNLFGGVTIKKTASESVYGLDLQGENAGLSGMAFKSGVPYFESHKTGSYAWAGLLAVYKDYPQALPTYLQNPTYLNVDRVGDTQNPNPQSYADGEYLNVYLHIGMGAVFGMADTTPKA